MVSDAERQRRSLATSGSLPDYRTILKDGSSASKCRDDKYELNAKHKGPRFLNAVRSTRKAMSTTLRDLTPNYRRACYTAAITNPNNGQNPCGTKTPA